MPSEVDRPFVLVFSSASFGYFPPSVRIDTEEFAGGSGRLCPTWRPHVSRMSPPLSSVQQTLSLPSHLYILRGQEKHSQATQNQRRNSHPLSQPGFPCSLQPGNPCPHSCPSSASSSTRIRSEPLPLSQAPFWTLSIFTHSSSVIGTVG